MRSSTLTSDKRTLILVSAALTSAGMMLAYKGYQENHAVSGQGAAHPELPAAPLPLPIPTSSSPYPRGESSVSPGGRGADSAPLSRPAKPALRQAAAIIPVMARSSRTGPPALRRSRLISREPSWTGGQSGVREIASGVYEAVGVQSQAGAGASSDVAGQGPPEALSGNEVEADAVSPAQSPDEPVSADCPPAEIASKGDAAADVDLSADCAGPSAVVSDDEPPTDTAPAIMEGSVPGGRATPEATEPEQLTDVTQQPPAAAEENDCSASLIVGACSTVRSGKQPPTPTSVLPPSGEHYQIGLRIGGRDAGRIPIIIDRSDNILVGVSGLLDAVRADMDAAQYERLRSSSNASAYVDIEKLRSMGFAIAFDDATDSLVLTVR